MKLTPEQQVCIDVTDRDLIVSAGAGAGKTATLIERLYSLLTTTNPPCSLDEILVVTFTRAAAEEMRSRLAMRLRAAITDDTIPSDLKDHLEEQLFLLPRAPISTLHSFCLTLISSYPEEVGLAPGFDLMSEEEARLFRRDFFQEKMEETLESDEPIGAALRRLLEELDPVGGTSSIQSDLLGLLSFLDSLPYPGAYIAKCLELLTPPDDLDSLPQTPLGQLVSLHVSESLQSLLATMQEGLSFDPKTLNENNAPQWLSLADMVKEVEEFLSNGAPLEQLDEILANLDFPRLTSKKVAVSEEDELFKETRAEIKTRMKKDAATLRCFLPEQLAADAYSCTNLLSTLLREIGLGWSRELFQRHLEVRRLTFAHLERLALRLLRTEDGAPSDIARLYRDKFRFVLVDEFQDINDIQNLIIRSVSREAKDDTGGNLFAVGDVKQSIYEFRLADPTLFLDTYRNSLDHDPSIPPGKAARINLGQNFRSAWDLLEEFNRLFALLLKQETVGLEYAPDHVFHPGRAEKQGDTRPPVYTTHILSRDIDLSNDEESGEDLSLESQYVADLVASIGPPWRDICILLRSAAGKATELVESLNRLDIPTFSDSRSGFLTAVEVLELQAILKTVYNPYDEIALLATLRGPAFRWNEDDLLALRTIDRSAFFIDNLEALSGAEEDPLFARAKHFLQTLDRWQTASTRHSMTDLITLLFDELHLLDRAAVRPGGDQRRLNLVYLQERARQFDQFLTKGLGAFLQFIQDLIENDEDFSPPSPLPAGADVVRIMTVHKSKGQQFPIVITPFLGTKFNETGINSRFLFDRHTGAATKVRDHATDLETNPPLYEALRAIRRRKERGEELRLLYVAQTRAREAVYMVGTTNDPEKLLDKAIARNRTTLPAPTEVLSAGRPLDWIYMSLSRRFDTFHRTDHEITASDGIASLKIMKTHEAIYTEVPPDQKQSKEKPAPSPETVKAFQQAIDRIQKLASHNHPSRIRAKISVTEAKRAFDSTRDPQTPPFRLPVSTEPETVDWLPEALKPTPEKRGGAERGQAIHRFLALCDLERLSRGERRLSEELERLQSERLLTPEHAAMVDLYDIQWFLNSDLGKRVRTTVGTLHREKALTLRIDGDELTSTSSPEPIILQGVIDLLFEEDKGWVIVDYKTDYCGQNGERIPELVEGYSPQVQLYRLAVERTLGPPISGAFLVFLKGRQIVEVSPTDPADIPWHKVVEAGAVIHSEPERRTITPRGV